MASSNESKALTRITKELTRMTTRDLRAFSRSRDALEGSRIDEAEILQDRFVKGLNKIPHVGGDGGKLGLRPSNIPGFDPVPPPMVVHDLLEHFPGEAFDGHAEFLAQGAAIWLRHEGGYWSFKGGDMHSIAADAFLMLFHYIINKNLRVAECLEPFGLVPLDRAESELLLQSYLARGRAVLHEKASVYNNFVDVALVRGAAWMRVGYRRASRRYAAVGNKPLAKLFYETEKKLEAALNVMGDDDEIELTINPHDVASEVKLNLRVGTARLNLPAGASL